MKPLSFFRRTAAFATAAVIAATVVFGFSPSEIRLWADEQDELEQKLEENKQKQAELDKKIKATRGDISKEKENQEAISEQIKTTEDYIRDLLSLIKNYDGEIEALETDITNLQGDIEIQQAKVENKRAEIDENISLYEKRIRAMYLSGNDSVASIILGSKDFFDMLMKIELVKRIAEYDNKLIDSLLEMKSEYEAEQLELENQKAALEETVEITEDKKKEVEDRKAEWDSKLGDLEDLYAESEAAIEELEDKKDSYEEDKEALDKLAEDLEDQIQEIIRKKARANYMGDLPQGTFLWPLPGYYTITSGYGSRWGTTHRGIDISGADVMGAEITAANSGEVIFVYNGCSHNYGKKSSKKYCHCGGGFGNYCIIDHGGGYQTLYGHATKITVKEGQKVSTGDVIGYVGSTGDSTGAHLHFETRIDGERVNPQGSRINLEKY